MLTDPPLMLKDLRYVRQLSMNALSDLSGVPVSTISRIESGKVEPTWAMMTRLAGAAGFRLEAQLIESGCDEPFAAMIRKLDSASPAERIHLIRRFPATAELALVAKRTGAKRVELSMELGAAVASLQSQQQHPVVSSMEAFAEDASRTRSFSPVIYVERPDLVEFASATRTSLRGMFLLPTTDNVRTVSRDVGGVTIVSREWALLDSLASPGRQSDCTLPLLDYLVLETISCGR